MRPTTGHGNIEGINSNMRDLLDDEIRRRITPDDVQSAIDKTAYVAKTMRVMTIALMKQAGYKAPFEVTLKIEFLPHHGMATITNVVHVDIDDLDEFTSVGLERELYRLFAQTAPGVQTGGELRFEIEPRLSLKRLAEESHD